MIDLTASLNPSLWTLETRTAIAITALTFLSYLIGNNTGTLSSLVGKLITTPSAVAFTVLLHDREKPSISRLETKIINPDDNINSPSIDPKQATTEEFNTLTNRTTEELPCYFSNSESLLTKEEKQAGMHLIMNQSEWKSIAPGIRNWIRENPGKLQEQLRKKKITINEFIQMSHLKRYKLLIRPEDPSKTALSVNVPRAVACLEARHITHFPKGQENLKK
jgi:hypothetical protein